MTFKVEIDLAPLLPTIEREVAAKIYPAVHGAVADVADAVRVRWQTNVFRALPASNTWAIERRDQAVESIQGQFLTPFYAIVASGDRTVRELEEGKPARDLKLMLNTSSKVRVSREGKRYLHIPFRHGTPGGNALAKPMPADVYSAARSLRASSVTGVALRPNEIGLHSTHDRQKLLVARNTYAWGGRLPAGLRPKLKPHHATDIYAGMVKMNTSTPDVKSSAYLTMRTMSESSTGWIVPATPGRYILRGIADQSAKILEDRVAEALRSIGV